MRVLHFREGLNGARVRELGSIAQSGDDSGDWNLLVFYLPHPAIPWDVLATHAINSRYQERYDVWCSRSKLERAIMRGLARIALDSEDGIEIQMNHPGTFVHEFQSWGPKFFGMRRSRLMKVLQLGGVIPWSNRRIERAKLLAQEGTGIFLEGMEDRFDEWDKRGLIVIKDSECGDARRLTMRWPPVYPGNMEFGLKSYAWLYWGR